MPLLKKLVLPLLCLIILGLMIFKTTPPESLTSASPLQLLIFLPIFLFLFSFGNIFLKNYFKSLGLSLGLLILVILKGLGIINLASLIILSLGLIILIKSLKYKKPADKNHIPKLSNLNKHK